MSATQNLLIKKMTYDPIVQPRDADPERVKEFIESMKHDEHIPPIKVGVRNDRYVVIDGTHRLEAAKRMRLDTIRADIINEPEEAWPALAVYYNDKTSKPLTPEQRKRKIIVCWERGLSTDDISRYMGRKKTYIYQVLRPTMEQKRKEREERDRRILELYEQGLTQEEIAREVGVTRQRVTQITNNANVSANGKTSTICKMKERNEKILELRKQGLSQEEIAEKVGITQQRVAQITSNTSLSGSTKTSKIYNLNNSNNLDPQQTHGRETLTENQHSPEAGPVQARPIPSTSSTNTANALQSVQAEPPEEASLASSEKAEIFSHLVQDKSLEVIPGGGDSSNSHGKLKGEILGLKYWGSTKGAMKTQILQMPEQIGSDDEDPVDNTDEDTNQSPDNSNANDIREISTYLNSLNIYKKLPPEEQKAIRAMELVKLYRQDVIDIMGEIGESPIWIRKILVAAISLALRREHETKDVVNVTNALEIDSRVGEVIRQFLPYGKMLCPIGPHMEHWVEENLSQKDVDLIAKLAGVKKSDLSYRIRGKKPPRTRHYKKPSVDELKRINEDAAIVRGWRDDISKRAYDNKGKRIVQACSNKITMINNELQDAIRTYYPDEVEKMSFGGKDIGVKENHVDQFANIVNIIVRKNKYRLPSGITSEDLEAECWIRVLEALESWDGTKGDINAWVRSNLEWKIKDLCKKGYRRQKTISRYLIDADTIVGIEPSYER